MMGLYAPIMNLNWIATPFGSTPEGGSGIVSASAQNVTIMGFSLRAISVTSGTVSWRWIAFGY